MSARFYQIQKNALQSGKALTHKWVLEYAPAEAKQADPLTGWAGSGDTQQQLKLSFPSQEAAIAYAQITAEGLRLGQTVRILKKS